MENSNIIRYNPPSDYGLTKAQVKQRKIQGLVNVDKTISSKSTASIVKSNLFTLFNFINIVLAGAILYTGSYRNLMFMGVVICNLVVGIFQEIKAKRTVDKLNLIASSNTVVLRGGKKGKIRLEKIVLDDIICLERGSQIPSDAVVIEGKCEVNESLFTGESDLILKKTGDMLFSGSYVVSGTCKAKVEHIGKSNYASQLLKGSKYIKKTKSEIMTTLNKIIKIISVAIIPLGAILFYRQFVSSGSDVNSAIVTTSAALTGMIPEGLVLLTSSVLAVGVMRLSKRKVLVQDMYSLETLARVDTLCLDKTGTITQGSFEVHNHISCGEYSQEDLSKAMKMISSMLDDSGETFVAIKSAFPAEKSERRADVVVPFSSEKKWSGIYVNGYGSLIMGAYEFVFKNGCDEIKEEVKKYSSDYRVLVVAHSENEILDSSLPENLKPMGFILIKDKIRSNAEKTLKFFAKQGVDIKVISGDDPLTVSNIAKRVNLKNAGEFIDAKTLDTPEKIKEAANRYTVFGRVTPSQKQELIKAIKEAGHTVAMVGDGVNDVLAMKESDCSVAMAGGSEIARNVSHIVLLNSDFASMPMAVAEGRRAINNIKRSSSLFLIKTIYSFLLSILFLLISAPYPFIPIQMTLISTVTIGIPSFVLALEPNRERIKGNLFGSIIKTSLPAALSVVFSIILSVSIYSVFKLSYETYSTINVVITGVIGIILIYRISQPLNLLRKSLLWCISLIFILGITKFGSFFELQLLNWISLLIILPMIVVATAVYDYIYEADIEKLFKKKEVMKN